MNDNQELHQLRKQVYDLERTLFSIRSMLPPLTGTQGFDNQATVDGKVVRKIHYEIDKVLGDRPDTSNEIPIRFHE